MTTENISAAKAEINEQIARLMMLSRVIVNLNEAGNEITCFENCYGRDEDESRDSHKPSLEDIGTDTDQIRCVCVDMLQKTEKDLSISLSSLVRKKLDKEIFGFSFPPKYTDPEFFTKDSLFFEFIENACEDIYDKDSVDTDDIGLFTEKAKMALKATADAEKEYNDIEEKI